MRFRTSNLLKISLTPRCLVPKVTGDGAATVSASYVFH